MHGGAPRGPARFAHLQMVFEQGAGAHRRECLQTCRALPQQGKRPGHFALSNMAWRVAGGSVGEQRDCFRFGGRIRGGADPGQRGRLLDHQCRLPVPRTRNELVAQPQQHDR